jgi:hypothetical protein
MDFEDFLGRLLNHFAGIEKVHFFAHRINQTTGRLAFGSA